MASDKLESDPGFLKTFPAHALLPCKCELLYLISSCFLDKHFTLQVAQTEAKLSLLLDVIKIFDECQILLFVQQMDSHAYAF